MPKQTTRPAKKIDFIRSMLSSFQMMVFAGELQDKNRHEKRRAVSNFASDLSSGKSQKERSKASKTRRARNKAQRHARKANRR